MQIYPQVNLPRSRLWLLVPGLCYSKGGYKFYSACVDGKKSPWELHGPSLEKARGFSRTEKQRHYSGKRARRGPGARERKHNRTDQPGAKLVHHGKTEMSIPNLAIITKSYSFK